MRAPRHALVNHSGGASLAGETRFLLPTMSPCLQPSICVRRAPRLSQIVRALKAGRAVIGQGFTQARADAYDEWSSRTMSDAPLMAYSPMVDARAEDYLSAATTRPELNLPKPAKAAFKSKSAGSKSGGPDSIFPQAGRRTHTAMNSTDALNLHSSPESCVEAAHRAAAFGTPPTSAALSHGMFSRLTPRRRRASRTLARIGHFSICPPAGL